MQLEECFIDHWIKHELYTADIDCNCALCFPARKYRMNTDDCKLHCLSIGVDVLYDLFGAYHKRYHELSRKSTSTALYKMFADIFPEGSV